jgi:dephospho-CoA kinase
MVSGRTVYNKTMLKAGLTGNYGMGKSYVLSLFRRLGAVTLDSDRIVGALLAEKEVIEKVRDLLGNGVVRPDGRLDKKAVAERIFSDELKRRRLEALLHPLVFEKIGDFISRMKDKNRILIVEVPLLFEGGYQNDFQKTITVHTTEEKALERLTRSGVPREEAMVRLAVQLPVGEKISLSDYSIDNNGTEEETIQQVETVYNSLRTDMEKGKSGFS